MKICDHAEKCSDRACKHRKPHGIENWWCECKQICTTGSDHEREVCCVQHKPTK